MVLALENLPYWIFLGAGVLLFGFVILSSGGDDDLDTSIDTDLDADLDIDADLDLDAAVDASASPVDFDSDADVSGGDGFSPLQILGWLGVGKAPLVLLLALDLCLWGLFGWMLNVAVGNLLGRIPTGWLGLPILLVSLAGALLIGGQVARPIGRVFASFGESASSDRLVGCVGIVSSARLYKVSEGKIAQVDVVDPAKNLVTVNAALPIWATTSPKLGEQVLVIDRADEMYLYYVVAKDSPDQDRWLNTLSRSKPSH
ncbi:MAG: DUF1449 domain-containing protein [Synechococcales bacterium]|nr:DUF1449 domain-containing protein [Synechococcales bacterium]